MQTINQRATRSWNAENRMLIGSTMCLFHVLIWGYMNLCGVIGRWRPHTAKCSLHQNLFGKKKCFQSLIKTFDYFSKKEPQVSLKRWNWWWFLKMLSFPLSFTNAIHQDVCPNTLTERLLWAYRKWQQHHEWKLHSFCCFFLSFLTAYIHCVDSFHPNIKALAFGFFTPLLATTAGAIMEAPLENWLHSYNG